MSKGLTIIDKDYTQWVENLSVRYRQSQIKAAVRVNRELLKYYWELGRDIEEMHVEERWGQSVIKNLSVDLQLKNPNSTGLSRTNIYYAKKFYLLYSQHLKVVPQTVGQLEDENGPQSAEDSSEVVPQPVGQLKEMLFSIPWGHHRYSCKGKIVRVFRQFLCEVACLVWQCTCEVCQGLALSFI